MPVTISAVMLTNDRTPGMNFVQSSLDSLLKSGFFEHPHFSFLLVNTYPDDNQHLHFLDEFKTSVNVKQVDRVMHYNEAMAFGLESAAMSHSDAILFMEDDIRVCKEFPDLVYKFIEKHGKEHQVIDFVTFYREVLTEYKKGNEYWDIDADKFYGNQCVAFSNNAGLSYARYLRRELNNKEGFADILYSEWLQETYSSNKIRCAVPSLAQHTGHDSNHGHTFFSAPCFADEMSEITAGLHAIDRPENIEFTTSKKGAVIRDINNKKILLHLNTSAAMIYQLCDGNHSADQIINILIDRYPENKFEIRKQVPELLKKFSDLCLIIQTESRHGTES